MISYQALLLEIEQLVANSKNSQDAQHIREQLSAIRALCNVGLSNGHTNSSSQRNMSAPNFTAQPTQSIQASPITAQTPNMIQNANSLNASKLKEDDANGDSIFDF